MIRYKYAKDENEKLINIDSLNNQNRNKYNFFCISCGKELIPRLGKVKAHHFAHKRVVNCSGETYLHLLGKQLFFDNYTECLKNQKPFIIEMVKKKTCNHYENELGLNCQLPTVKQKFDLTQYFNKISKESREGSFIPDILLSSKSNKEKVFVEIAVTHQMSEQKYNSNYRIIEIDVEKEEDVEIIKRKHLSIFNSRVHFINFKTPEVISSQCNGNCKMTYNLLTLDKYGMCMLQQKNLKEIRDGLKTKMDKLVDFRITEDRGGNHFKMYKNAVKTYVQQNLHVRNCFICHYQSENIFYDENLNTKSQPVMCQYYKSQCEPSKAVSCKHFKLDKDYL